MWPPFNVSRAVPAASARCVRVYLSRACILRVCRAALTLEIGCCYDSGKRCSCRRRLPRNERPGNIVRSRIREIGPKTRSLTPPPSPLLKTAFLIVAPAILIPLILARFLSRARFFSLPKAIPRISLLLFFLVSS